MTRHPDIVVSSANGRRTPARLHGVSLLVGPDSTDTVTVNIWDCGSAITLIGEDEAERWLQLYPSTVKEVKPLSTSIQRIRGIGASNAVVKWISFRLTLGGAVVFFADVPVIRGHRGLLLGNDLIGAGRALHDCSPRGRFDGFVTLRDRFGQAISTPIPFSHHAVTAEAASVDLCTSGGIDITPLEDTSSKAPSRTPYVQFRLGACAGGVTSSLSLGTISEEAEELIREVAPIAFAPERVRVAPWAESLIRLRIPNAAVGKGPLALLPLEDARLKDLQILLSPGLVEPDSAGYVTARVINMNPTRPVEIPKLTAVGRFIVNPSVINADLEFTVDEILEQVHLRDGLSQGDRDKIRNMLVTRRRLFRSTLGYVHGAKMEIHLPKVESGEENPPADRNRVRSPPEERALKKEIDKQLRAGLIEAANSPFNAIPMLIRKPGVGADGDPLYRVVLDYRKVNLLTAKCTYPLPNLEQNLSALGRANWFTTLDLLQGFHQVELAENSRPATAFGTKYGQYQYTRAPMGLTSSPSTFVQLVDSALRGLPPGIALAYVDDVIIPTCGTFEEHLRDVGMVLDRLIEAGFAVRCDKMWLGMREVPYLGFLVGAYGTRPIPAKTDAITNLKFSDLNEDASAAARFCGMISFYARFIPGLHNKLAPFHKLKSKGVDVKATMRQLKFAAAFATLKHELANATALTRPDFSKRFYIDVDAACSSGIGACLCQYDGDDNAVPLAFWSRRFSSEERRYGVRDQECLGLSDALSQWRHYVLGTPVTVRSDHKSLRWLLSTAHPDGSRVASWALKAQGFDLTVEWVPGKDHIVPDFFSRHIAEEGGESGGSAGSMDKYMDPFHNRPSIEERVDEYNTETTTAVATTEGRDLLSEYSAVLSSLYQQTSSTFAALASIDNITCSTGPIVDELARGSTATACTLDGVSDTGDTTIIAAQAFVFTDIASASPKLLVVERIKDDNLIFVPGGKMEFFDGSPLTTCRRELYEEAGFTAPYGSLYRSSQEISQGYYKGSYELHDFALSVDHHAALQFFNKEPHKHANMRWIDLSQLAQLEVSLTLDRLWERTRHAFASLIGQSIPVGTQAPCSSIYSFGLRHRLQKFVRRLQQRATTRLRSVRFSQRRARRVAIVFLRQTGVDSTEVLVEFHSNGEILLPAATFDPTARHSYRAQLSHRLQRVYERSALLEMEPAVRQASSHHLRPQADNPDAITHFFVAVLRPDVPALTASFSGHAEFHPPSQMVLGREFIKIILTAYQACFQSAVVISYGMIACR